jgi:hypothetical protein
MPGCALCSGSGGRAAPIRGDVAASSARSSSASAAGTPCSCYMPGCVRCFGGDIDVATTALTGIVAGGADVGSADAAVTTTTTSLLTGIVAARGRTSTGQQERKRKHCPRPGHVSCTLAQELEEDRKTKPEGFDDRFAALAQICTLMLQPALSALELIGRPRGERWDFWEIYSGCGRFTAAVLAAGLVAGPPVDISCKAGGLAVDVLLKDNQALLQAVLEEARPRWLHLAPPCTFWTPISRWTASKKPEVWARLRACANEMWVFALHLAVLQSRHGRRGSLEQPPRCASWRLRSTQEFYIAQPDWQHFCWPSCAYGMCDPVMGAPWKKMQGFLSNADLGPVASRKCECRVRHAWAQGQIMSGPRRGEKRTAISGEYPVQMCQALASVVRVEVCAVP